VPAANCSSCVTTRYDSKKSSSAVTIGGKSEFHYGDGTSAAGIGMSDTVTVADITILNQFFIQVDSVDLKSNAPFGGILGLGHHRLGYSLKDPAKHTFIWSLFAEHPQLPRQFSFFLSDFNSAHASELVIGEPDVLRHAKEPIRFSKSGNSYGVDTWLASMWSIGFSGTGWVVDFPDQGSAGVGALVDSGSSLIVLRPDIYADMVGEIKKHLSGCSDVGESLSCDCPANRNASIALPSLVLAFLDDAGGIFSLCMTHDEWLVESRNIFGARTCDSIFQKGDMKQPTPVILGMTFMRSFYTTFDVENQRIGFARSSGSAISAGITCHVGFSLMRMINFEWVFFAASFTMAIVAGCLCGYFICPNTSCCEEQSDEETTELLESQTADSSRTINSRATDSQGEDVELKAWCT